MLKTQPLVYADPRKSSVPYRVQADFAIVAFGYDG
jgi:hypothetical protein